MAVPLPAPVGVPPGLLHHRTSALTIVSMIVLGVGTLAMAVLVFLAGGPVGALICTLLAAGSFPLLIALCFWLDRYEPEPARYRLAALGWGGVVAVAIGGGLTQALTVLLHSSEAISTAVWAPISEEFGKGLFLVLIMILRRQQLHGLLDGIVYAALVGIGFAFTEDILYYLGALNEGVSTLEGTFILRGLISPFAHPLFTSATGVGIGIAVMTRSRVVRVLAPIIGYVGAVALHGTWNGSATWGGIRGFFIAYGIVMLPLLIVLVVVGVWARKREGRMLTATLGECVQLGWVPPSDVRWVATLTDRMTARSYAKRVGGKPAKRALREYQQTLTEMAFLHNRVRSGTGPRDANARMSEIIGHAAAVRPWVVLPVGYPAQPQLPR
jgi:protease PrsW